ncbi:MAG: four helix bundle protein [Candidatus Omnitrophica bacterium]|nr:four helix bundle protein [Candidatus Omnitrophota bacterium]
MVREHESKKVYKLAGNLVREVYENSNTFPRAEQDGLTHRLQKTADLITTNIVEGVYQDKKKNCLQFLYRARRSINETGRLLQVSNRLGYLDSNKYEKLEMLRQNVFQVLFALIVSIA